VAADALEEGAGYFCEDSVGDAPNVEFITDGCSAWFDGRWVPCCVEHDIEYWCEGTSERRRLVDREFRECLKEFGPGWLAWLEWPGVRVGGHPIFPTRYRCGWGFGREYSPFYPSPVATSEEQVSDGPAEEAASDPQARSAAA
jgi:hypothetical protein